MIVNEYTMCEFSVVVETPADHRRVMQARERSEHGTTDPDRRDHRPDT